MVKNYFENVARGIPLSGFFGHFGTVPESDRGKMAETLGAVRWDGENERKGIPKL